jgi:hypothetical protein
MKEAKYVTEDVNHVTIVIDYTMFAVEQQKVLIYQINVPVAVLSRVLIAISVVVLVAAMANGVKNVYPESTLVIANVFSFKQRLTVVQRV